MSYLKQVRLTVLVFSCIVYNTPLNAANCQIPTIKTKDCVLDENVYFACEVKVGEKTYTGVLTPDDKHKLKEDAYLDHFYVTPIKNESESCEFKVQANLVEKVKKGRKKINKKTAIKFYLN